MIRPRKHRNPRRHRLATVAVVANVAAIAGAVTLLALNGDMQWVTGTSNSGTALRLPPLPSLPLGSPTPGGHHKHGGGGQGGNPSPTPAPGGGGSQQGVKPEIAGLLDRHSQPSQAWWGTLAGWVVNANWSDLQPQAGGPIASNNVIDQAIAAVRQINAQGHDMHLKIRIFTGQYAPAWAKNLDGGPVTVHDPTDNRTGTVGRFWTADFGNAYVDLQNKLAALYDGLPEIQDVTIARCTTIYSEPFIRDIRDQQTVHNLLAAGYSLQADQQCQRDQIDAHQVWQHTHSSLSFNPYQVINSDGSVGEDESFTQQMMAYCRQSLGNRCVLENNSIRAGSMGGTYGQMYSQMHQAGPDMAFQTATPSKVGNLDQTLQWAVQQGANAVELPSSYGQYSQSNLQQYNQQLQQNAQY